MENITATQKNITKDQKKEIEYLKTENSYARYDAGLERSARSRAEKVSETSILAMYFVIAIMFSISVHNYLFV